MKKPNGVFGTGVSLEEMKGALNTDHCLRDPAYLSILLAAAVEKLICINAVSCNAEVSEIIDRPEWIENLEGLSR